MSLGALALDDDGVSLSEAEAAKSIHTESCSDIEVEAAKSRQEVCRAVDEEVRKSVFAETDIVDMPFELEKAHRSAPHWATKKWSSFTTGTSTAETSSGSLLVPGLRSSDEVNIHYLESTMFTTDYVTLQLIGSGSFGAVCLCREKKTDKIFAVKAVKLVDKHNNSFFQELAVCRRMKHENIVELCAAFRDEGVFYFVMENLAGGSVFLVLKRNPQGVRPDLAREYTFSLLSPVQYLHHHRICHRDIKAENVLLQRRGEEHPIKLIDFGLATRFKRGEKLKESVGTLYSMAPEVAQRLPYNETVDVWSAGCVVFEICTGHAPYVAKYRKNLVLKITTMSVTFNKDEWKRHPPKLQAVVKEMLNRNQEKRKHAYEILQQFPFLSSTAGFDTDSLEPDKNVRSHNPISCCCVT